MSIKVLKLMTGEEVIADVEASNNGYLVLTNAVSLVGRPDENGQMRVGMMPFAQFSQQKTVVVYPHAVVADYEPALEIINQYNKIFGSGIQIATADMIPR